MSGSEHEQPGLTPMTAANALCIAGAGPGHRDFKAAWRTLFDLSLTRGAVSGPEAYTACYNSMTMTPVSGHSDDLHDVLTEAAESTPLDFGELEPESMVSARRDPAPLSPPRPLLMLKRLRSACLLLHFSEPSV